MLAKKRFYFRLKDYLLTHARTIVPVLLHKLGPNGSKAMVNVCQPEVDGSKSILPYSAEELCITLMENIDMLTRLRESTHGLLHMLYDYGK